MTDVHRIQLLVALGSLWPHPVLQTLQAPARQGGGAALHPSPVRRSLASRALKRFLDLLVSGLALVLLAPVLLGIAIAIALCDGGPVLFRHRRVGRDGVAFDCYKFRSMARDAETRLQHLLATDAAARREWEDCRKLRVDPRVHAIGDLLRRSSLDELPQLANIFRGDMSLVGPRPIVTEEIARFGPHFADYKEVRPGLTGLWQVSGRSTTSYEERVALDRHYVAHGSTLADLSILLKTPLVVWRREGSC